MPITHGLSETTKRISQLRELTDILQSVHPELPESFYIWSTSVECWFYGSTAKDDIARLARAIRRAVPGATTGKHYQSDTFKMVITIPDNPYEFELMAARSTVCTRIETGETVTKEVRNYSAAPMMTVTEPVIKWECDPILES